MLSTTMTKVILAALGATGVAVAYLLCRVVRRLGLRFGAVVPPRSDRWHSIATPTFGGVAIVLTSLYLLGLTVFFVPSIEGISVAFVVASAAAAMFIVGLVDDALALTPLGKLVSSLVVGAFFVFGLIAISNQPGIGTLWAILAIVWFAGMVHSVNLLDNMDGLASGVVAVACLFFVAGFSSELGGALVSLLVIVTGSVLGFLVWNRPPARLFMGDSGSLFLGAILAGTSLVPLLAADHQDPLPRSLSIGLILVVPLFDTAFVLVLRRLAGRKATSGGTDHVSHRLASLGFSPRSTVRILYAVGIIGGLIGVVLHGSGLDQLLFPIGGLFMVAIVLFGLYLSRVPAYDSDDFLALQKSSFAPFLQDLAFKLHVGQVLLDMLLISSAYYLAYAIRFEGDAFFGFFPTFTSSLPVILGCKLLALYASGLYARSWTTFGMSDVYAVVRGIAGGSILSVLAAAYLYRFELFSRAVFLIDAGLLFLFVIVSRASFRLMSEAVATRSKRTRRVLIYGAGSGGQLLAREMRANRDWSMSPVGFLDDNPVKQRRWVLGLPVRRGAGELELSMRLHNVDELIISSDSIDEGRETRIRKICERHDVTVRRLFLEIR